MSLMLLLQEMAVTSVWHNHHDRMMRLVAVLKFGEIKLDLKNQVVAFLERNIWILYKKKILMPSQQFSNFFDENYLHLKINGL